MDLLIDLGNSALKWATIHDGFLSKGRSFLHKSCLKAGQFEAEWAELSAPNRVVIASVLDSGVAAELEAWIAKRWQSEVIFLSSVMEAVGVTNAYQNPSQLGIDRWAAIVAAYNIYKRGCLIVDCGTATTLDIVDDSGRHQGGLIIPGLRMMQQSLASNTSQLKWPTSARDVSGLGRTTDEAITAGVIESLLALVEVTRRQWESKSGKDLEIIVTGGDADKFIEATQLSCRHVPDLVIEGIALLDGNCLKEQQI